MANLTSQNDLFRFECLVETIEMKSQDSKPGQSKVIIFVAICILVLLLVIVVQVRLHFFLKGRDDRCINRFIRSNQVHYFKNNVLLNTLVIILIGCNNVNRTSSLTVSFS
jgi:hypothetical protein